MNRLVILAALLLLILLGSGFTHAEPLRVGVVIDLLKAGLSEDSIQSYIENNQFYFDLAASELEMLKEAGASEELVLFLQERTQKRVAPSPKAPSGARSSDRATEITPLEYDGDYLVGYAGPEYVPSYSYGVYLSYPYSYYPNYYGSPYYYGAYPYYGYHYGHDYYSDGHHHSGRVPHEGSRVRGTSDRSRSSGTMNRSSGRSSSRGTMNRSSGRSSSRGTMTRSSGRSSSRGTTSRSSGRSSHRGGRGRRR